MYAHPVSSAKVPLQFDYSFSRELKPRNSSGLCTEVTKRVGPRFVPAVACLNLHKKFSQPATLFLAHPCTGISDRASARGGVALTPQFSLCTGKSLVRSFGLAESVPLRNGTEEYLKGHFSLSSQSSRDCRL